MFIQTVCGRKSFICTGSSLHCKGWFGLCCPCLQEGVVVAANEVTQPGDEVVVREELREPEQVVEHLTSKVPGVSG